MKPSILLRTKFLPPRLRADYLPRPRLADWLSANSDRRLILLSAPAGYGKTTLLADFLASNVRPFAWYQLDAQDSDPAVFLTYLIEALRRMTRAPETLAGSLGEAARLLLDSGDPGMTHQRVLTVLLNEIPEQIDVPWLLVLEDYHFITSPVVHRLMDFLLENAPPGLQIVLSTRADPPLALARLRARGQLAELRAPALRFREDELSNWLAKGFPQLSNESLSLLNEKTEGWAAALQIVRSSLGGLDAQDAHEIISGLSGSQQFVFDYLAEEVFRRLPEDIQEFLLRTSVLHQLDASACNAVAAVTDAQAILEELEKQNLFLSSLDSQRRWYRYHYLFREFLLSRLQRRWLDGPPGSDLDQLEALELRAAAHYETRGELEVALSHYLAGHDADSAARIISAFAADYVERGRVEALHRHIGALPAQVLQRNPELLLQHGNVHWRLGQSGEAVAAYEDARAAFAAQDNRGGVCRALTRLAEVNRAQGNYRQAQRLSGEALAFAPPSDHAALAAALMAQAKSIGFMTGMDQGRALAEQALAEARLAGDSLSQPALANFLQSLGQICWWHGDPQATVKYCQEALQLAPADVSPIAAQAHVSMTTPYLYWRELDEALRQAELGLEIAQTLQLIELLPSAYTALGNVLTRLGETGRAEACLRQGMEIGRQVGLASYEQLMATGFLAYNLCGQGRADEARQLAEGGLWSYTGSPDTYEAYVCRSVLADVALETDDLEKAERLYAELVEVGERRQFRIPLAMVYFGLAYIHLQTGRPVSGLENARRALQLIEPSRAFQLFLDQGSRSGVVCEALVRAGERSPFLERVLEHLPTKASPQVVLEAHSIVVQCLGAFRVWVKGEEVTQERWVSGKARDLLAYFITMRGERVPADRAFEAIWRDKPGTSRTAFHTALSRLRHALRSTQEGPRLILVEVGEYWLDSARFRIDVDEFDSAMANARAARNSDMAAEWYQRAASLYLGEYLPNLYYEWVFPERRRLVEALLSALQELATYSLAAGSPRQALSWLERAISLDPVNEELYRQAMRAHAALGDRAGLARRYQEARQVLAGQLGLDLMPGTTELYLRLMERAGG